MGKSDLERFDDPTIRGNIRINITSLGTFTYYKELLILLSASFMEAQLIL